MGNLWVQQHFTAPDVTPRMNSVPQFDPLFGFPNGRKERVMIASDEEIMSARLEPELRNYCAHKALNYLKCASKNWPWPVKCAHERHDFHDCFKDDYYLRMKEFEREKRMLRRAKRVPIENAGWKQAVPVE